jgi:hypothetical protein
MEQDAGYLNEKYKMGCENIFGSNNKAGRVENETASEL